MNVKTPHKSPTPLGATCGGGRHAALRVKENETGPCSGKLTRAGHPAAIAKSFCLRDASLCFALRRARRAPAARS